ncbi:MAG: glutaredoxin domain-containing protein [Myxococcota bacterium]
MRRLWIAVLLTSLACQRGSPGPSPEYKAAMARFDAVMSETLDPSYGDPAFDEVEQLLRAVPKGAKELGAALSLADEIRAGRGKQRAFFAKLEEAQAAPEEPAAAAPAEEIPPEASPAPAAAAEPPSSAEPIADQPTGSAAAPAAVARRKPTPSAPVIMYTTSWCGVCKRAKAYFSAVHVSFIEKDVESDENYRDEYLRKRRTNRLREGVPMIDVDGEFMVGFSESSMKKLLVAHGYL